MSALFDALRKRGWVIRELPQPVALLPADVAARYPSVPRAITDFLGRLDACHNAEENVWFMTPDTFRLGDDEEGFHWNEYERMALESEKDEGAAQRVRAFWNDHFPIMMAVHSDYDYVAVRVVEPNAGSIVHGFAPEWEQPSPIDRSFEVFLQSFAAEAASRNPEWPYDIFV